MKKQHYFYGVAILALVCAIPAFSHAESLDELEASQSINASISGGPGGPGAATLRERINADIKDRNENIKNNQGVRNNVLENRIGRMASTSTSTRPFMNRERNRDNEDDEDNASSSVREERNEGTKNMFKVRKDVYEMQKNKLTNELTRALNNLKQVRARIADRISRAEASGRDMTAAKAALVTADAKLVVAQNAIITLQGLTPVVATTTASTTITATTTATTSNPVIVDLGKPRQVGSAAIQAIKDAQRALNAVVVAIAHAMGLKVGQDGTIIPPTPTPSASPTATPTATPSATPTPTPTSTATPTPTPTVTPTPTPTPTVTP